MKSQNRFLFATAFAGITIVSFAFGGRVPFNEQLQIYEGLRNTSAIVFGVMGAWIALLYPGKLSQAFKENRYKLNPHETDQINKLFQPMVYSTFTLIVVIGVSFSVPLARHISYLHPFKEMFRAASYGTIALLTFLQFWSIILTLIPGDLIKEDLDHKQSREALINRMKPGRNK